MQSHAVASRKYAVSPAHTASVACTPKSTKTTTIILEVEINNGRLAMIGLMAFLSEGAVPGAVPALKGLVPATGEVNVMAPFAMFAVQGQEVPSTKASRSGDVQMFSEGDIGQICFVCASL